jgi:two-component system OmpR family response regulator
MTKPLTKILFVDDDADTLTIAKFSLQTLQGVEVKYAGSGEEAIKIALEFQPDVILLDVMMPKMDGFATMKAIRELDSIAHIPIVFFTAKVQKEEIASYNQMGVIGVIVKPFDPLTLGEAIQRLWEQNQQSN